MTAPASSRRGSFFETWRIFAGGAGRTWGLVFYMVGGFVAPLAFMAAHGKGNFLSYAVTIVFCLTAATWQLESEMGERLGFLSIVPQPVDTRRLVLVPMCALGLVLALLFAGLGRQPALVALALLGVAWWTAAGTRWLWKLRFWPLFVLPVLAADPLAAYAVHRAAGWGAAAAVSLVLGIGALVFQPRPYVGESVLRRLEGGRTAAQVPARGTFHGAISSLAGDRRWFASARRFMEFHVGARAIVLMGSLAAVVGLSFPILGSHLEVLIWPAILLGQSLSTVYSGDMHEFLHARPLTAGQRFVGGALPAMLIPLVVPATAACFVNLDWINHCGLLGLFKRVAPNASDVAYLRDVLGATFLPEKWPEAGLAPELWARLRPLLYVDALRAALVIVAILFAVPIRKVGEVPGRPSVPVTNIVILLIVFASMVPLDLVPMMKRLPLHRLWFLALLAAAAVTNWIRHARKISAPARGAA